MNKTKILISSLILAAILCSCTRPVENPSSGGEESTSTSGTEMTAVKLTANQLAGLSLAGRGQRIEVSSEEWQGILDYCENAEFIPADHPGKYGMNTPDAIELEVIVSLLNGEELRWTFPLKEENGKYYQHTDYYRYFDHYFE